MPSAPLQRWTLIYDRDCGFCRTLLAPILAADVGRRIRPLALGTPEADALLHDLTPQERNASFHLVSPDGRRESAGAAGAPLLRLLPGGAIPAALLRAIPGPTESAYAWVAGHRTTFGRRIPDLVKTQATKLIDARGED